MWTHLLADKVPHFGRVARATRWRRVRGRPRVWAHRGASALEPENTLAAFAQAKADGADGVELDVRCDASGVVVVFHDDDLVRLCGRTGTMESLSSSERAEVRVREHHAIPTLAEALAAIAPLEVNVELKTPVFARPSGLPAAAARVIRQSGAAPRVLVSSFDPVALLQFHAACPEVAIAFLFHQDQRWPVRAGWAGRLLGPAALHPDRALCTAARVAAWQRAGYAVNVWTVNEPAEVQRLAALGVDGIFTDDPGATLALLAAGTAR